MSDGLLVIIGIIFVFIVWVWTGGPTRPISFSGPFITPLTTVGDVQTGYGPQISTGSTAAPSGSYWSLKSTLGGYENSAPSGSAVPVANQSPYHDRVSFSSGASGPSYDTPDREYVSIRSTGAPVDVTGWAVISSSGHSAMIPQAAEVARRNGGASLTDIVLQSGEEAVITTGNSPAGGDSYRSTECTRYLGTSRDYDTCLGQYRHDTYFAGNTWLVFLNRDQELWRNDHETLKLVDKEGRTVDQYSY